MLIKTTSRRRGVSIQWQSCDTLLLTRACRTARNRTQPSARGTGVATLTVIDGGYSKRQEESWRSEQKECMEARTASSGDERQSQTFPTIRRRIRWSLK